LQYDTQILQRKKHYNDLTPYYVLLFSFLLLHIKICEFGQETQFFGQHP
jgi:hypothetical protein